MRAPLGQRGSLIPTAVNVMQGLGWTVFELLVIATAAAAFRRALRIPRAVAVDDQRLRPRARAARAHRIRPEVHPPLRDLGGAVRARLPHRWTLDGADLGALWDAEGEGGLTVWQGADVVVGITVSWCPSLPTTRASRRLGAVLSQERASDTSCPDVWLLALGTVLAPARPRRPRCITRSRRRGRVRRCCRRARASGHGD